MDWSCDVLLSNRMASPTVVIKQGLPTMLGKVEGKRKKMTSSQADGFGSSGDEWTMENLEDQAKDKSRREISLAAQS